MLLSPQTVELKARLCSYVNMAGNERTRKSDRREWGTTTSIRVKGNPGFVGCGCGLWVPREPLLFLTASEYMKWWRHGPKP